MLGPDSAAATRTVSPQLSRGWVNSCPGPCCGRPQHFVGVGLMVNIMWDQRPPEWCLIFMLWAINYRSCASSSMKWNRWLQITVVRLRIVLGGIVVNMLAIGSMVDGFTPGRGRWNLRAIKICSTISFGREVKPLPHVVWFYGLLKIPAKYDRNASSAKFKDVSRQLSSSLLGVSAATRELWWMKEEGL
jgi:hypothetical protein